MELQDADGRPVPGYALRDCDAVVGNTVRKTVSWGGKAEIDGIDGPVRLRVAMRAAKLYAFQFAEA